MGKYVRLRIFPHPGRLSSLACSACDGALCLNTYPSDASHVELEDRALPVYQVERSVLVALAPRRTDGSNAESAGAV